MGRPEMLDVITRDRRRLVGIRAVTGTATSGFPDIEALWVKPILDVVNGPAAGQRLSLEDLIDRHRRLVVVDGGDGPAAVESVFASLLFVTAEAIADPAAVDRFIRERIRHSFGPLIDPLDPVGVAVETSLTAQHALTVHLGYGVHAPPIGMTPRGRVLFRPEGEAVGTPVTLPGGREAGLYPGQRWLAFARSEAASAAVHPDLPAGAVFLLSAPGEIGSPRAALSQQPIVSVLPLSNSGERTVEVQPAGSSPSGVDVSVEVCVVSAGQGRARLGHVDVIHDARPSRLLATRPSGAVCLRVLGVAVPGRIDGSRVERFWLDLDGHGRPRIGGLQPASRSLVVRGGRSRTYARDELAYRAGATGFSITLVSAGREMRTLAMVEEGELGFIALPGQPRGVTVTRGLEGADLWPLDWIDEALVLDLAGRGPVPCGLLWPPRAVAAIGARGAAVTLADRGDAFVLAHGKLAPAPGGVVKPGTRLVLGPLVVEVSADEPGEGA